jgi:hypothetical protein
MGNMQCEIQARGEYILGLNLGNLKKEEEKKEIESKTIR